jgi:hypothetical protein
VGRELKRRKGVRFCRRLQRQVEAYERSEITLEQVTASVQEWVNHVRYGNTVGLRKKVLGGVIVTKIHHSDFSGNS